MEVYAILFFEANTDTIVRKSNDSKLIPAGQTEQVTNEKWADNVEDAKAEALAELPELLCEGAGTWYVGVFSADPEGDDDELLWESIPADAAKGANTMTALNFINARAIRSREVLSFVLKNEIAQIEEKHAQYDTLCATAKEMEKAGQYEIAKVCNETASGVIADLSLAQVMYAYVLTGDAASLSSADIDAINALPYLKNR